MAQVLGAFLGCLLLFYLWRRLLRRLRGPGDWVIPANALSACTAILIAAYNLFPEENGPQFLRAALVYVPPQLVVFAMTASLARTRKNGGQRA